MFFVLLEEDCWLLLCTTAIRCHWNEFSPWLMPWMIFFRGTHRACRRTCAPLDTMCDWPNKRPEFLRVGKRCLELDCWCPRLGTAVEVNGAQHHKRIAAWQTEKEFQTQQSNDLKKKRICDMLGILLLTVPPRSTVGDCDLPRYVLEMLSKHKVLSRQPFRLL